MGDIGKRDFDRLTEWVRYYPEFGGFNAEWDEGDRWWVELRRHPSRTEMRKLAAAATAKDAEEDYHLLIVSSQVKGPYNLTINGEAPETFADAVRLLDSQDLMLEVSTKLMSMGELTEDERGNSEGLSGGDTTSQPDVSPEDTETETPPASGASATPEPSPAQSSTTAPPESGESLSTKPPEDSAK